MKNYKLQTLTHVTLVSLLAGLGLIGCTVKIALIEADPKLKPLPTFQRSLATGIDPRAKDQLTLTKLGIDLQSPTEGADAGSGGYKTRVALIGTGIDYLHDDLSENIAINLAEKTMKGNEIKLNGKDNEGNGYKSDLVGYDFVDDDGLPYDGDGVDTQAAGVIGAVTGNGIGIRGIAPFVSMLPIRYIDSNGTGTLARLQQALIYAAKARVEVVYLHLVPVEVEVKKLSNMSETEYGALLTAKKNGIEEALKNLNALGIPVITTAGMGRRDLSTYSPSSVYRIFAQFPNVVFVNAVDNKDQRLLMSNYGGSTVSLSAPATNVVTTLAGNKYGEVSGSHLAAAHAAGAVALAISKSGGRKPAMEIIAELKKRETGDPLAGSMEYDSISGARLNVAKLLQAVLR